MISTWTIYLIFKTSEYVFDKKTAKTAEFLTGIYPPFLYYCTKIVPTTFFLFFLSLVIFLILTAKGKNLLHYSITGIVLGLTILCDPIAMVIYPAILIIFLVNKSINFFRMLLIVFFSLVVLLPWTIRNYNVHKAIVPVTTQFGVNFWIGNNPNATGTDYFLVIDKDRYTLITQTLNKDIQDSLTKISEVERSNFYFKQAIDFIKKKPSIFAILLIKKFYYYFWFAPTNIYISPDDRYRRFYIPIYLVVLVCGILGIIIAINQKCEVLLILTVQLFISAIYIFSHVGLLRYRMPVELYLLMFSAFFIKRLR